MEPFTLNGGLNPFYTVEDRQRDGQALGNITFRSSPGAMSMNGEVRVACSVPPGTAFMTIQGYTNPAGHGSSYMALLLAPPSPYYNWKVDSPNRGQHFQFDGITMWNNFTAPSLVWAYVLDPATTYSLTLAANREPDDLNSEYRWPSSLFESVTFYSSSGWVQEWSAGADVQRGWRGLLGCAPALNYDCSAAGANRGEEHFGLSRNRDRDRDSNEWCDDLAQPAESAGGLRGCRVGYVDSVSCRAVYLSGKSGAIFSRKHQAQRRAG
jgi:hypothetical protein